MRDGCLSHKEIMQSKIEIMEKAQEKIASCS